MLVQIINDTISIFQMNVKEKSNLSSEPIAQSLHPNTMNHNKSQVQDMINSTMSWAP